MNDELDVFAIPRKNIINAGLIAAADLQTLAQVRALFEAVRLPLLAGLPAT